MTEFNTDCRLRLRFVRCKASGRCIDFDMSHFGAWSLSMAANPECPTQNRYRVTYRPEMIEEAA